MVCKEQGCWAHVRRKFANIIKPYPESVTQEMVNLIGKLYQAEKIVTAMELCDEGRKGFRKRKSKPILKKIYRWLKGYQHEVVPKSQLGQKIDCVLNQWQALMTFLADRKN